MPPGKGYSKPKSGAMGPFGNQPKPAAMKTAHAAMHGAEKKAPKKKGK